MIEKLHALYPEMLLFVATCAVLLLGLSRSAATRRLAGPVCIIALVGAGLLAYFTGTTLVTSEFKNGSNGIAFMPMSKLATPYIATYGKIIAAAVGVLLAMLLQGVADRDYEDQVAKGRTAFDPARTIRAEFWAFFLFSITGLMLTAGSDNLIWLFLALELTSLPTYVMVAVSTARERSMESGVKYFFLGAMGAAVFLFGFAFIYGGTGTTSLAGVTEALRAQQSAGGINGVALAGLILTVLGLCFKIAAVPMHAYVADVYQGAHSSVSAMLAFVPKAAGFFALILILACPGWGNDGLGMLPGPLSGLLAVIAALTMTAGNILALLQTSVKRMLAYSSIAHSGYMLVGLVAGPGSTRSSLTTNGIAAILFYLVVYGVTSVGTFAVLAALERRAPDGHLDEPDSFDDLRGLRSSHPTLAWVLALSALGLMGFPPLVGFFAKLPFFTAGWSSNHGTLVLILAINSAVGAVYYLRLVYLALIASSDSPSPFVSSPFKSRALAGCLAAAALIVMAIFPFTDAVAKAGGYEPIEQPNAKTPSAEVAPTAPMSTTAAAH
ncbi:MAG: NADH-quinone oxidoreductase subunit N [Phycisphaerales bacterium]